MMKKSQIFLAIVLLTIIGCKKNDTIHNNTNFSKIIDLTLQENLTNELGIYTENFKRHNGIVNIRSTIKNGVTHSGSITAGYFENLTGQRTISDGGDYFINDIQLKFNGSNYLSDQLMDDHNQYDFDFINNFIESEVEGKEIRIKNVKNNEVIFDEVFYVPDAIYLKGAIENKIAGTPFSEMGRNNFTFSYNHDAKNENGLLILLVYSGESYGMSLDDLANMTSENNLQRVVHVHQETSGSITIPSAIFDGIPSDGIVTMYIGRGGGKLIQIDNKEYYIKSFIEQQLRVVIN